MQSLHGSGMERDIPSEVKVHHRIIVSMIQVYSFTDHMQPGRNQRMSLMFCLARAYTHNPAMPYRVNCFSCYVAALMLEMADIVVKQVVLGNPKHGPCYFWATRALNNLGVCKIGSSYLLTALSPKP